MKNNRLVGAREEESGGEIWDSDPEINHSGNTDLISSSHSSEEQITTYRGHDSHNDMVEESSFPEIPRKKQNTGVARLSQSLPDLREETTRSQALVSSTPRPNIDVTNAAKDSRSNSIFTSSWLGGHQTNQISRPAQQSIYSIEYSVFRPVPYLETVNSCADVEKHLAEVLCDDGYSLEGSDWPENYIDVADFRHEVNKIVLDVDSDPDLEPLRISQGSSGSYFILGKRYDGPDGATENSIQTFKRGVFKPKDEEPYGPLSPKWSKWLHRTFFPCFFGRSCLIPNLGYISEAAACVLDRQLMSFVVPYTDIIHLKSDQFYYSFWERARRQTNYKIGSYQYFLNGYVEAIMFFKQYPFPRNLDSVPDETTQLCYINDSWVPNFFWSKASISQFQDELEKLVVLDYIMRNTDRGLDNWMVKIEWVEIENDGISKKLRAVLKIGAIDSGLAFPWKHPDEWRSFPFGWLFLPYYVIGRPFSNKARKHYLPLLTSRYWWEQTTTKLKAVFQKDADFKERMWHKQIAVVKGQAFNVVEVLKLQHAGPLELIRREKILIWDDTMNVPSSVRNETLHQALESSVYDSTEASLGLKSKNCTLSRCSETTPLLKPKEDNEMSGARRSNGRQMSGFDFNMSFKERGQNRGKDGETDTRTVIIERLEKVSGRRPVFTWC